MKKTRLQPPLVLLAFVLLFADRDSPAADSRITRPASLRGSTNMPVAQADPIYLQETGRKIPAAEPLLAIGIQGSNVYAGTSRGLLLLAADRWADVPGIPGPIRRIVKAGGSLWAIGSPGLSRNDGKEWTPVSREAFVDVTVHGDRLLAATARQVWRVQGNTVEPISRPDARFDITHVLSHQDSVYLHGHGRLTVFAGGGFGARDVYDSLVDQGWDWGTMPSTATRDALVIGPVLYLASDRGLVLHRGMSLTTLAGSQGLPIEDTACLAEGFDGDLWIGTRQGAVRRTGSEFHYFAGQRWLPDDRVNAIAVDGRDVYLATDGGLGVIGYVPFTLSRKAAYYEQQIEEWGQKRMGLVQKLEWDDALHEFVREAGDNDGGYSGSYLAAQSYRFAVTRDPAARREATNTFHALRWLESATGIPGFPARSIWAKGEIGHKSTGGSGGYPAEWHDTADGKFEWKGDTSSDELCSHFYSIALFIELAAEGPEIEQARTHLARIASHVIEHEWQLVDLDGKATRWGRWDPEYFKTDEGKYDRGLQCLELLSFIKTASVLGGDPRFAAAYGKLIGLGYPQHTLRESNTFPPENVLHFLDELAFWSYWNLLRYEDDPELRALYRRSLERTYEMIRVEQQPWFNFVYSFLTGNESEADLSVKHLRDWPLDLRSWSYRNSHRADLRSPAGYVAPKGGTRAFPARETEPMRWDHWTLQADGGSGGRDVVEPSAWLLAYWMGRYHGYIAPPQVLDTALAGQAPVETKRPGARPYAGPPRP